MSHDPRPHRKRGADAMDITFSVLPVFGIVGLATGLIDLRYDHSAREGFEKTMAFLISHAIYVSGIVLSVVV